MGVKPRGCDRDPRLKLRRLGHDHVVAPAEGAGWREQLPDATVPSN